MRSMLAQLPELGPPSSWPSCLRLCGMAPEISLEAVKGGMAFELMKSLHQMYIIILSGRKLRGAQNPTLFTRTHISHQLRTYPYHQLVGPIPRTEPPGNLLMRTPSKAEWQRELPFLADMLRNFMN